MRTNVFVDGYNLYYGSLKDKPGRKWLDLSALAAKIQPKAKINRIRYFTALVHPRPHDPQENVRQQTYLRALRTLPNLSIHLGQYRTHDVRMRLASPPPSGPTTVLVTKTDEKGSDVNLASYLLCDAFDGDYEQALVISNDSDLTTPIEMVATKFRLPVVVFSPHDNVCGALRRVARYCRPLRPGPIEASQFPPTLQDGKGSFTKPAHW